MFQSTRPRGARPSWRSFWPEPKVSIHAPTWGATPHGSLPTGSSSVFQSTRPRGARHGSFGLTPSVFKVSIHAPTWGATTKTNEHHRFHKFQSTRPRGARQRKRMNIIGFISFNPRAHVGRDFSFCYHALSLLCFNPRAHVGRDVSSTRYPLSQSSFNPRAHVGRDAAAKVGTFV